MKKIFSIIQSIFLAALILTATACSSGDAFDISSDADICSKESGIWRTSSNQFTTARNAHTTIIHNNRFYIIGGVDTGNLSDIQFALINKDGSTGVWTTTTPLPSARAGHTSVVNNNFIYIAGGSDGSAMNDVHYAPINADGTIGSWTATTSFTTARSNHTSVVHNGYIYVIGGYDDSNYLQDIQYAPINPNGTIGSWSTASLPEERSHHTSVITNGFLYVLGGEDSSIYRNDVKYAALNPTNGAIGTWQTATSFNQERTAHACIVYRGRVYVVGGFYYNSGEYYLNDVQSASINSDGSLGTWRNSSSLPAAKAYISGAATDKYIYITGGYYYDLSDHFFNDVQYILFCN